MTTMKALSFDTILGALVVVSVGAGCTKKAESVAPAPETTAVSPRPTTPAANDLAPVAAPSSLVDAGVERTPPPAPRKPGAAAACGAGGCSPEMKKGNK